MTDAGWDNRDNREQIMILSDEAKQVLIVVLGVIIFTATIFAGIWTLTKCGNVYKENLYSKGYSNTYVMRKNGSFLGTTWIKGNGTPVVVGNKITRTTKNTAAIKAEEESTITHDEAIEFLRNEVKENKND